MSDPTKPTQTAKAPIPNPVEALVEQRIEEQAGVPLSQMTGEQAVAAMLAAAVAPSRAVTPVPVKSAAQLLTEYLTPLMEGSSPEASRAFLLGRASAVLRLLYPAKPFGVADVVAALLGDSIL